MNRPSLVSAVTAACAPAKRGVASEVRQRDLIIVHGLIGVYFDVRVVANGAHGRISEAHYSASFGSEHSFHVNRGDYDHRRFAYGGYNFGFVQPWPVGWGYDDYVDVVYT